MIIKILIRYILGYVSIIVEGYYIERFINICTNNKILIWKLKRDKGTRLYLNLGINNFREVIKIAKKTKCKIHIEKKYGIPFLLNRYRKRKIFAILLILVIFSIYASSNYVWNIEVQIEENEQIENIMEDINSAGLKIGIKKKDVQTKQIINNIRLSRDDISWMGIDIKGTNAIVKIVKNEEPPEIINEEEYCNIVAKKSGIITKIVAQNGTSRVKVGDTVNEGDILIEGVMEGKYTGIRNVHSIGEIEAKVWYTENKKIYYESIEKKYTGNEETKYTLKLNNFEINLYKTLSKFKIYDTINAEKRIKIFSNLYLPISIVEKINKEQEEYIKKYTLEEAKAVALQELEETLNEKIGNKENVINTVINTYEKENYIEISLTYEMLENIGTKEKIKIGEEE